MRIDNFRHGFATNSSSSHSVVILPDDMVLYDNDTDGDFGWQHFICASQEAKLRYLTAQVLANVTTERARAKLEAAYERCGLSIDDALEQHDRHGLYVDHQSAMHFKDERLIDALIPIFLSPKVAVLGGNDNSDPFEIDGTRPEPICDSIMSGGSGVRARIDGDYVTVFNTHDGTKVRVATKSELPPFVKGSTPELVDLKITDYCDAGCSFCYQSSTVRGQHADYEDIKHLIECLGALDVFEIAIGGGEPTKHPRFFDILRVAYENDIKPNFTTLSGDWLEDDSLVAAVQDYVGGIGVSCLSEKGLDLVRRVRDRIGRYYRSRIIAQHVIGSVPLNVTAKFLNEAFADRIPVLLLGYKDVGFGADYRRHDKGADVASFLRLAVSDAKHATLSIDTALVDQYPDIVRALGAVEAQVTSPEGAFSCYIDAVERKIGPSSYAGERSMLPLDPSPEGIKTVFEGF